MKEFKNKITKQLVASYVILFISDLIMAFIYMMVYNHILTEIIDVTKINFVKAYAVFYIVRLIFNRNKLNMNLEEEIFDSFKRNIFKAIHYIFWGIIIKLLLIYLQ